MFLVGLISWWYGRGWVGQWGRMALRFKATLDFFSVGQLLSTLFAPFRQISATSSGEAGFAGAMRAMLDKLISRILGAIVRSFTILFGLIVIIFQAVYELILVIGWWFLPILPIAGLILLAIGWVPVWM
jgi:hypothetical protein